MVLTGSANAVVPKKGSEAYDTSKAALNHLIRELAIGLGPLVRVNGIAPATVVTGSTMFPRDRVIQSLQKYKIEYSETDSTEELRDKLANYYAQRTLTKRPILPQDCANAIVWLASDRSAKTTGTLYRLTAACGRHTSVDRGRDNASHLLCIAGEARPTQGIQGAASRSVAEDAGRTARNRMDELLAVPEVRRASGWLPGDKGLTELALRWRRAK